MVCRKSIQFCKTIIHRKRTKEKRKNKKEEKERERILLTPFLSLLYLFTQENTSAQLSSAHFTSKPNQQPTNQAQNVHNRNPLHSTSHLAFLPPPIPPPLHPLNPLLHHTNHDPHHLSHHHPKTQKTPTHLGRNFPLNSMDNSPFADGFTMHEQQQQ